MPRGSLQILLYVHSYAHGTSWVFDRDPLLFIKLRVRMRLRICALLFFHDFVPTLNSTVHSVLHAAFCTTWICCDGSSGLPYVFHLSLSFCLAFWQRKNSMLSTAAPNRIARAIFKSYQKTDVIKYHRDFLVKHR
jgi:hypothetical protein